MHEPKVERDVLEFAELVGVVVADHRRMRRRRPQVLSDGEDAAPHPAQVAEGRDELVVFFEGTEKGVIENQFDPLGVQGLVDRADMLKEVLRRTGLSDPKK